MIKYLKKIQLVKKRIIFVIRNNTDFLYLKDESKCFQLYFQINIRQHFPTTHSYMCAATTR